MDNVNSTPINNCAATKALDLPACGSTWTGTHIFEAKEWFAQHCLQRALGFALVVMARRGVINHMLAEDATMEWLAARFERMVHGFDAARGNFCSFALNDLRLYITGTFIKIHENRPEKHQSLDEKNEDSGRPSPQLEERESFHQRTFQERLESLDQVLNRLSAEHRQVLLLAAAEFNHAEIAAQLGLSEGAARVRLCRARGEARRLFRAM
jgi:RNA polymerase sigma factor (sigma-70 family)